VAVWTNLRLADLDLDDFGLVTQPAVGSDTRAADVAMWFSTMRKS
jgi:hypothetical protein